MGLSMQLGMTSDAIYLIVLTERPITVFTLITRQQAQVFCKHILACSCSQIGHTHTCSAIALALIYNLDLLSTYSHNATRGKLKTKKTVIVLIGMCKTNKEIPKQTLPMPRMKTHRVVISIISYCVFKLAITSAYLITCAIMG